ncbi:MAG: polysulfide reductase NrfD, partial [Caldilineaceae bacterium]|nr:polysulfide reductase NrfD [Caldilineaceae bacterium]
VHSIVSFDFAVGIVPGWHSTIFPPYFVAGAIYSGFAMVMTIAIPLRWAYGLQDFITMQHLNNMAKLMLATSLIVGYGYILETFMAWYSGNRYEEYMILNRMFGPYAFWYWVMLTCNVVLTQVFWSQRMRRNLIVLFVISLTVNIGMWLERFIIVVTSLSRDFLPSSWGYYTPSIWDWATFVGTLGLFVALIFLFVRLLPMISIFEMRELVTEVEGEEARRRQHAAQETQGGLRGSAGAASSSD